MECALGQSPFPKLQNVFDFMNYISKNQMPALPADKFSAGFQDFIANCLIHNPAMRPSSSQMLVLL